MSTSGLSPSAQFPDGGSDKNKHGGDNDADNSGTLKYVRVEFAGIELTPNNETNSITMGGVGSGTQMDYCQVSFGGDDGFEWFGGSINSKYLIAFPHVLAGDCKVSLPLIELIFL